MKESNIKKLFCENCGEQLSKVESHYIYDMYTGEKRFKYRCPNYNSDYDDKIHEPIGTRISVLGHSMRYDIIRHTITKEFL